jgi:hypothetical protein
VLHRVGQQPFHRLARGHVRQGQGELDLGPQPVIVLVLGTGLAN